MLPLQDTLLRNMVRDLPIFKAGSLESYNLLLSLIVQQHTKPIVRSLCGKSAKIGTNIHHYTMNIFIY